MQIIRTLALALLVLAQSSLFSKEDAYFVIKPKPGDGKEKILLRYSLPATPEYIEKFEDLNPGKFGKKGDILLFNNYRLPVKILKTNGKSLRSVLGTKDKSVIESVKEYNDKLLDKGILDMSYTRSGQIYVPELSVSSPEVPAETDEAVKSTVNIKETHRKQRETVAKLKDISTKKTKAGKTEIVPLFGKNYETVSITDRSLDGNVYYLDPGHGGPDPGAIGLRNDRELCEDEYAYDITLRLARNLISHGGKVYVIVRDTTDGIRDGEYLEKDDDEFYLGDYPISEVQKTRLDKRAEIINRLYDENEPTAKSQQLVVIHLDSRVTEKRIDIFFYNKPDCPYSLALAKALCKTVKDRYSQKQPGRGYTGSVSPRNLLMLRETKPTSVYIELGNIQNPADQNRFIQKDNRQAIANWLYKGLSDFSRESK